tara:strand:+ start:48 stop:299 length:252 start_codon:yes stop_codon:yes gene_type:complete
LKEKGGAEFTFPRVGLPLSEAIDAIVFGQDEAFKYCHYTNGEETKKIKHIGFILNFELKKFQLKEYGFIFPVLVAFSLLSGPL